jgi:hypothetical protein
MAAGATENDITVPSRAFEIPITPSTPPSGARGHCSGAEPRETPHWHLVAAWSGVTAAPPKPGPHDLRSAHYQLIDSGSSVA